MRCCSASHDAAQHAIRADIAQFTLQLMHHLRVEGR
jgi:hypothetical protein